MNKTQLVDALAARLGDRKLAASAVDGLLDTIVETVKAGEQVAITGFGVFEGRARSARVARNPRTGATVDVPATTVPAFRPGAGFRTAVGGGHAPVRATTAATLTTTETATQGEAEPTTATSTGKKAAAKKGATKKAAATKEPAKKDKKAKKSKGK